MVLPEVTISLPSVLPGYRKEVGDDLTVNRTQKNKSPFRNKRISGSLPSIKQ